MKTPEPIDPIIKEPEVLRLTGIGRTTRWKLECSGEFPSRLRLSPGRVGWRLSEVQAWISNRSRAANHPT